MRLRREGAVHVRSWVVCALRRRRGAGARALPDGHAAEPGARCVARAPRHDAAHGGAGHPQHVHWHWRGPQRRPDGAALAPEGLQRAQPPLRRGVRGGAGLGAALPRYPRGARREPGLLLLRVVREQGVRGPRCGPGLRGRRGRPRGARRDGAAGAAAAPHGFRVAKAPRHGGNQGWRRRAPARARRGGGLSGPRLPRGRAPVGAALHGSPRARSRAAPQRGVLGRGAARGAHVGRGGPRGCRRADPAAACVPCRRRRRVVAIG
mmetsp:Transcript_1889/g.6532  ORF Transcript_1889/g.6532 Transcript_1889/m.6532 type:complete len:264 (-) Transcript_1889:64-855(-)